MPRRRVRRPSRLKRLLRWAILLVLSFYGLICLSLFVLKWVHPFTTSVQTARRVQSWFHPGHYEKRYLFVPLDRIAPMLQHAVIAAEDTRFYQHHGFDWKQISIAVQDDLEEGRSRGASTITQQLVKNLFLSTSRSFIRKGVEFTIVPLAELILGKQRILELYLNVSEWGPGIYGAEAAAIYYYRIPAANLTREQAVQLAAIIPAPLHRRPGRVPAYSSRIQVRMREMHW